MTKTDFPGRAVVPDTPTPEHDFELNLRVLQEICDSVSHRVPCDISIMTSGGVIVASSIAGRVGKVHEGAERILAGELDELDVTAEMERQSSVMLEGCNQPVVLDGERVASVGITAPLVRAREYAAIVQICIEVMLREYLASWKARQLLTEQVDQTRRALREESAEKRLIEESLTRSEQRLRDITDYMFDSIWETGPDHRFTFVSEQMVSRLGLKFSDVIGKTRWEYVRPMLINRDDQAWADHQRDMEAHRDFREFPYTVRTYEGEPRHLLVSGRAMFDESGTFVGYRGAARDATDQVNAEEALKESEIRFKHIAETSSDWIWVMDKDLRFTYLSDRFYQISQRRPEEMIGKTRFEFVGTEVIVQDPEKWSRHEQDMLAHRPIREFEYSGLRPDGERYTTRINGSPYFLSDGTFNGYHGTATDLTELKQVHEQLKRNEKLAALGGMVAGLAHEINTPVGNALTAASFLAAESDDVAELAGSQRLSRDVLQRFIREAAETGQIVTTNLERAITLIENFKQVAVDQSSDQIREFNLLEYIEAVRLSLQPALKGNSHQLLIDCPGHIEMKSDPGSLHQVLTNLIMNSMVHGFADLEEGRGRIEIMVSELDQRVRIDYRDNGAGMTLSQQQRMFEPFFTTRRGSGSSGLGMYLVHSLVTEVLQGNLNYESQPGAGVSFSMLFPRRI